MFLSAFPKDGSEESVSASPVSQIKDYSSKNQIDVSIPAPSNFERKLHVSNLNFEIEEKKNKVWNLSNL